MSNLTSIYSGNETLQLDPGDLCTLSTCDLTLANLTYLPSLGGNGLYTALFSLFIVGQIYLGIRHRTWGFMVAMSFGLIGEIIGYAARIMMNRNPFDKNSFLTYLICLTIAPAFFSAAIYLCLARIVIAYGEHISRFRPGTYTLTFCGCDFLSLLLQAIGGAIASIANDYNTTEMGIHIMMAGLCVQVASLTLFALLCGEFALRLHKNPQSHSLKHEQLCSSKPFKLFLVGLSVATIAIFIRSTFRVAELSGGFRGPLANNQISFMILEGAMIIIACSCLTFLHPGVAFQGVWDEANFTLRKRKTGDDVEKSTGSLGHSQTVPLEYIIEGE